MTARKSQSRGVRRGAGSASGAVPRLGREFVDDLMEFFRGEHSAAWCLLLDPQRGYCLPEVVQRWNAFLAEHPGAPMPAMLAEILVERWEARLARDPNAIPPANLALIRQYAEAKKK